MNLQNKCLILIHDLEGTNNSNIDYKVCSFFEPSSTDHSLIIKTYQFVVKIYFLMNMKKCNTILFMYVIHVAIYGIHVTKQGKTKITIRIVNE